MSRTIDSLPQAARNEYPYTSRFAITNGYRMHYIDEGDRNGRPVLLLHGNPAWGYLWRRVIPPLLAAGYRVIVPDQIGFGLSEKPASARAHTLDNHTSNVVALLDQLDLRGTFFVMHDWGGPTGLGALVTRPERAAAVAVMSTWAWCEPSSSFHRGLVPWRMLHAPVLGPYLLGRKAGMPARAMYLSVVDRGRFRDEAQAVFTDVLSDPDERQLTWLWPRVIPLSLASDIASDRFTWLEAEVKKLTLPATVIWGAQDDVFRADVFAARWHEIWPHAEGTHLVTGRHFLQEDSGSEIGRLLVEFAGKLDARDRS